ncbi:hypothetical protein HC762_00280 [bacterium]|nr:hypothetical protein [bacterium]
MRRRDQAEPSWAQKNAGDDEPHHGGEVGADEGEPEQHCRSHNDSEVREIEAMALHACSLVRRRLLSVIAVAAPDGAVKIEAPVAQIANRPWRRAQAKSERSRSATEIVSTFSLASAAMRRA